MNKGKAFSEATKWLTEMSEEISHGEITLKVIVHDGHVKRIEKGLVERTKPENFDYI